MPLRRPARDIKAQVRTLAARPSRVTESDVESGRIGERRHTPVELSYEEFLHAHFGPPRGEVIGIGEERGGGSDPRIRWAAGPRSGR